MKKPLILLVIAAVVVGAYLLMKSKDKAGEPTTSPSPSVSGMPGASKTPVTTPGAGTNPMPKTHQVTIQATTYSTASLTVKKGDKVTFTNQSSQPQNVTADNAAFNSGDIAAGGVYTLDTTNLAAGTYMYHSSKQPNMKATLIVQ